MALTTVNSDGVKDDSIKNIDVKSDAAIDGSKINPDFGSQNIVTTGNTGIGAAPTTGYQLQVTGQSGYDDIARITAVGTNMGPRINFTPTGTGTSRINATANNLALQTGGTTGLTIDTSGNTISSGELFADDHLWMVDQLRHTGDTDTAIRFPTADTISFETAGETRLKIDSDGRLLQNITAIGDYMHQMEGAGGTGKVPAILFKNGTAATDEIIGGWTAYNTSNQSASIYAKEESANDDAYLQFSTRATGASLTERLRITSGGSLQVKGDANPNAVFDRGSANTTNVNFNYNGTLTGQLGAANGEFQISAAGASTPLVTYVNGKERLRITSDGYIKYSGSSTSDETNKLGRFLMPSHDTNEEDVMYFQMQQEGTFNQLELGGGSSSYNAATQIILRTAAIDTVTGAEALRINSEGDAMFAGLTVSRPAEFAHPDGFSIRKDGVKGQFQSTVDANSCGLLNRDSSDGSILSFRREGADVGHIGVTGTTTYLQFGGTNSDLHRLDDYELGSFTPVFKYKDSNNVFQTCTFSNSLDYSDGRFVKIGKMVHGWYYSGYFEMGSAANGNLARIFGLPFPLKNAEPYYGGTFLFTHSDCFSTFVCGGHGTYDQSYVQPMKAESGTGGTDWNTSGHYCMFSFTYETDL